MNWNEVVGAFALMAAVLVALTIVTDMFGVQLTFWTSLLLAIGMTFTLNTIANPAEHD